MFVGVAGLIGAGKSTLIEDFLLRLANDHIECTKLSFPGNPPSNAASPGRVRLNGYLEPFRLCRGQSHTAYQKGGNVYEESIQE